MANAQERLRVFENILARVGVDGDVLGEYSRAMSSLHGLDTYNEINPPLDTFNAGNVPVDNTQQGNLPPEQQDNVVSAPPLSQTGENTAETVK